MTKNVFALLALIVLSACSGVQSTTTKSAQNKIIGIRDRVLRGEEPTKVTFILTNDLHGQLEPTTDKQGRKIGGMAYLAGAVEKIRQQPEYVKNEAALFVLDSGDQFQGTLASNFDEGRSVFQAMSKIGYDAVVPGNHDYDFGPSGWLHDKVTEGKTSNNPREVIENLAKEASFPLLSANTYLKSTMNDAEPKRPDFLKPYVIIEKAGVKVALIGIDNHGTPSTTIAENVSDLHFRDEVETYLEIRRSLEGKADIFVMMIHNGNTENSKDASEITKKINEQIKNGVHLVAAGHTHMIHNDDVNGVKVVQNGDKSKHYGKIDLYIDPLKKTVLTEKTVGNDTIALFHDENLKPSKDVEKIVNDALGEVNALANRRLGEAKENILRDRQNESALSNFLTDTLRAATGAELVLINTGGIRENLPKGTIYYTQLFDVLPISNHAVKISLTWKTLKAAILKSVKTCGGYGALMASGLKVTYEKTCDGKSKSDETAKLTKVETVGGKVLLDSEKSAEIKEDEKFTAVTLDFLASGGSGYEMLKEATLTETLDISREMIANQMEKSPTTLENKIDQRFVNTKATASSSK